MDNKCLKCQKIEKDCNCEGGFKIIFLFGKPVSKKEIDEHSSKSKLEQKIEETKFLQKRIDELNQSNAENMGNIIQPKK